MQVEHHSDREELFDELCRDHVCPRCGDPLEEVISRYGTMFVCHPPFFYGQQPAPDDTTLQARTAHALWFDDSIFERLTATAS